MHSHKKWVRVPPPVGWTPYFYRACVPQRTTEDQNGILTDTERPPQRLNAAGLTLAPDWRAKVLKTTRAGIFFSAPMGIWLLTITPPHWAAYTRFWDSNASRAAANLASSHSDPLPSQKRAPSLRSLKNLAKVLRKERRFLTPPGSSARLLRY